MPKQRNGSTHREGHRELAIFLTDLPQRAMAHRLGDALRVYVDAMGYPRGTESQRAAMWLEHSTRPGWKAVAAFQVATGPSGDATEESPPPAEQLPSAEELSTAPLLGIAYGYPGAPDQWWQQQVTLGLQRSGFPSEAVSRLMNSYFELSELHIDPRTQGRGLGEALTRQLLANRAENHVLLSTPESNDEPNRAWRLYRRLGFTDFLRGYHFAGDPRAFAVLGRTLPL